MYAAEHWGEAVLQVLEDLEAGLTNGTWRLKKYAAEWEWLPWGMSSVLWLSCKLRVHEATVFWRRGIQIQTIVPDICINISIIISISIIIIISICIIIIIIITQQFQNAGFAAGFGNSPAKPAVSTDITFSSLAGFADFIAGFAGATLLPSIANTKNVICNSRDLA